MTPCKVCHRHVRAADGKCPFCGTLAAAALAIGLAFFAACGGKTTPPSSPPDNQAPAGDARPADEPDAGEASGPVDRDDRVQPMYGVAF